MQVTPSENVGKTTRVDRFLRLGRRIRIAVQRRLHRDRNEVGGALGQTVPIITKDMTIDMAWKSHPQARDVFARRHLPNCDGCSVRFDETLEEASEFYGFDLEGLLEELQALIRASASV